MTTLATGWPNTCSDVCRWHSMAVNGRRHHVRQKRGWAASTTFIVHPHVGANTLARGEPASRKVSNPPGETHGQWRRAVMKGLGRRGKRWCGGQPYEKAHRLGQIMHSPSLTSEASKMRQDILASWPMSHCLGLGFLCNTTTQWLRWKCRHRTGRRRHQTPQHVQSASQTARSREY